MNFHIDSFPILFVLTILTAHIVSGDIQFSPHIQDHIVLQQAPHKSAVYGTLIFEKSSPPPTVEAIVRGSHNGDSKTSYTIPGRIITDNSSLSSWIVHLPPTTTGGNFSITVTCIHCSGTRNNISIHDVTFGEVWYCGGQSNMALPLLYTLSRNTTLDRIRAGRYSNIRIYGIQTNMNPQQNWTSVTNAAAASGATKKVTRDDQRDNATGISSWLPSMMSRVLRYKKYDESSPSMQPPLFGYSSTCYYFAESLTDLFLANNPSAPPPPIGLIHTAWGGSWIQQWISNATLSTCSDIDEPNQDLYDRHLLPFVNMTVKGFLWYQGESNMHSVFGNAHDNRGYSCALVKMIQSWRDLFSHVPETTDPLAPFGLVTLTMGGSEGMEDMGGMYKAQTGGYGILPNPLMPNTFAAQGFDLDDPFMNTTCGENNCMTVNANKPSLCAGCDAYIASVEATPYVGYIHPRDKKIVGDRLASAAYASVYGGGDDVHATGPVLSGCRLIGDDKLVIYFNRTLLGRDMMEVGDYYQPSNATYLQILTNASLFCLQGWPIGTGTNEQGTNCTDDGTGRGVFTITNVSSDLYHDRETWPMVPVTLGLGGSSLVADVSGYKGRVHAVRYGWMYGNDWKFGCCGYHPPTSGPCPVANCPLKGGLSGLPVNPFIAKIEDGRCVCIAPQVCDESDDLLVG